MRLIKILLFVMFLPSVCFGQTAIELKNHVSYLASDELRGRHTGSTGYDKAANYVATNCRDYGLTVRLQAVPTPYGPCKNVIAWINGVYLDKVIVLGAHLDHIGANGHRIYNGADDNASGSAAVLGLARRFSTARKPRYTIVFQWYTGEERGFIGSEYYVAHPLLPEGQSDIKKHVFMLNFDMVGRLRERPTVYRAYGDLDIPTILDTLYTKYSFARGITYRTGRASDQIVFAKAGMPVVWLFTGTHSDYHKTTDTADKINYDGMVKICDYAADIVYAVMGTKEIPDYKIWESLPVYRGLP